MTQEDELKKEPHEQSRLKGENEKERLPRKVTVLRLGHRVVRDQRISTHLGLTARALGADEIYYSGEEDENLLQSLHDVVDRFGGSFKAYYLHHPLSFIRKWNGISVHLTMYGIELADILDQIRERSSQQELLVIVGGPKVPAEVYELSNFNVAIGNQPHSEVAALAIFLDRFFEGRSRLQYPENAKIHIYPSERGRKVKKLQKE